MTGSETASSVADESNVLLPSRLMKGNSIKSGNKTIMIYACNPSTLQLTQLIDYITPDSSW